MRARRHALASATLKVIVCDEHPTPGAPECNGAVGRQSDLRVLDCEALGERSEQRASGLADEAQLGRRSGAMIQTREVGCDAPVLPAEQAAKARPLAPVRS